MCVLCDPGGGWQKGRKFAYRLAAWRCELLVILSNEVGELRRITAHHGSKKVGMSPIAVRHKSSILVPSADGFTVPVILPFIEIRCCFVVVDRSTSSLRPSSAAFPLAKLARHSHRHVVEGRSTERVVFLASAAEVNGVQNMNRPFRNHYFYVVVSTL